MAVEDEAQHPIGSRFSRWFSNQTPVGGSESHHSSRNASRRSSMTEDFNFINGEIISLGQFRLFDN
jgi:hypothetical protein